MEADNNKRYPTAVVLPLMSFIAIAVCIPMLVLHAKNRNFPAANLICWSIVLNLFNVINALLWPTDDIDSWWNGAGLCDIEVKIMVAGYVAVPGNLMCIFRSLAIVLDTRRTTLIPTKTQRWRNRFMEMLFCVVVPIIAMITHYVWQKSRYLLYSISGCVNNFDESWVSLVLAYMWPPIICLMAAYYCCLVLFRLHRYRSDFGAIIHSANSNLSKSRFLRLFFLAFTMLLAILPVQGYVVYYDLTLSLPWHAYSWNQIHGPSWYKIIKVPTNGVVFFDRWTPIASAFMIFIFFGFGRDATRMYRIMGWYMGLGHCFPSVVRPLDSNSTVRPAHASSSTTLVGSIGSKAKMLFRKRKSSAPPNNSNKTIASNSTYNDIEKGTACSSPPRRSVIRKSPWLLSLRFFRRHLTSSVQDGDTLLDELSVPSQTVCTNAWAGTSQNRDSSEFGPGPASASPDQKEFIRIKQVISQQSEVQV